MSDMEKKSMLQELLDIGLNSLEATVAKTGEEHNVSSGLLLLHLFLNESVHLGDIRRASPRDLAFVDWEDFRDVTHFNVHSSEVNISVAYRELMRELVKMIDEKIENHPQKPDVSHFYD